MARDSRGKGKKPKKEALPWRGRRERMERSREGEVDVEYINSLRQRIRDQDALLAEKEHLIRCMEEKERRLRIWSLSLPCNQCTAPHTLHVALVNRKVYRDTDYARLVRRLQGLGYKVKENVILEKPPQDGAPYDDRVELLPIGELRDQKIPDGISDAFMKEVGLSCQNPKKGKK